MWVFYVPTMLLFEDKFNIFILAKYYKNLYETHAFIYNKLFLKFLISLP